MKYFGIAMAIIYVAVGIGLYCNFFNWDSSWDWLRWVGGSILVLYGIFRGWRIYKGIGYYK